MNIVFYIPHINNIGGIESWIYYISKLYGDNHNITLYYSALADGAEEQINRLRPYIRVRKYFGQTIKCDVAIFAFALADTTNFIAKEKIAFIHAAYSLYGYKNITVPKDITKLYAVSEYAAKDFEKLSGVKPEVLYNPIDIDKPKKLLKLISATRISEDKGSIWDKMKKLANKLNDDNIPFIWLVFTNNYTIKSNIPNVVFVPSTLNITNYIAEADYLVQLSKSESYAYSVIESLIVGTPVLVTNFEAGYEMGIRDGENGYVFDMNLTNINTDKIYNHIPKFKYTPRDSSKEWNKLLGKPCKKVKNELVWVRCVYADGFQDYEYDVHRKYNDKWQTTYERAESLMNFVEPNTFTKYHLIDIID